MQHLPEQILDFSILHEITDGDLELEKRLFGMFLSASDHSLDSLKQACNDPDDVRWRVHAHSLKGAAMNIGAQRLAQLSAYAQTQGPASSQEKLAMLQRLEVEYEAVRQRMETRA